MSTTLETSSNRMSTRQRLTAFLLLGTSFMLSVDFSILNVALPQVGDAVGLELALLPWVVTAYALPAAGFTLLFGRISDLIGRRQVFLAGIVLLALSSLLGAFATNPTTLLAARTLQGFATAIATPASLALLITAFTDDKLRARVLGLNGALLCGGFTVGALAGGSIVDALGWQWAFLINVPVAVVILAATAVLVSESRAAEAVKLDLPGAIAVTLGLLTFAFGVTNLNLFSFLAGIALLALFWVIERRANAPLIALHILSRPSVKWGNLAGLTIFTMESALIYLMTLYLQDVLHLTPQSTGLIFGIPGLASVAAGIIAGRFIIRHGSRKVLIAGLLVQTCFTAPLILLGTDVDVAVAVLTRLA